MVVIIKTILILVLIVIFFQDIRSRRVYAFLFPLVAITSGYLYYTNGIPSVYMASILVNIVFISALLLSVLIYSKLILRKNILEVMGLGDILMFTALAFSFSSVAFIVLFVSALVFSLLLHLILSRIKNQGTVPLAGYMGLFFCIAQLAFWLGITVNLFPI